VLGLRHSAHSAATPLFLSALEGGEGTGAT